MYMLCDLKLIILCNVYYYRRCMLLGRVVEMNNGEFHIAFRDKVYKILMVHEDDVISIMSCTLIHTRTVRSWTIFMVCFGQEEFFIRRHINTRLSKLWRECNTPRMGMYAWNVHYYAYTLS